MTQIKLKITNTRLNYLPDMVYSYADHLTTCLVEFQLSESDPKHTVSAFQLSISLQLYELLNKKTIKRYPAKQNSLKLEYHEARTLASALAHHVNNSENDYTRSIARALHSDLEPQIPNTNQLKTIQLS